MSGAELVSACDTLHSPGTTHVEHRDESCGWYRFTMTVRHALFGELFYQTGRFRARQRHCPAAGR